MVRFRSRRTSLSNRAFAVLGAFVLIFQAGAGHAQADDDRLTTSGTIAGRPATFALDTGAQPSFAITAADARRFGLQVDRAPPPEAVILEAISTPADVVLQGGHAWRASFAILKEANAPALGLDAIIGWPVLKAYVMHYDRQNRVFAIGTDLQHDLANARSFPIVPSNDLVFDAGSAGEPVPVLLDTGDSGGVMLTEPRWNEWRRKNPDLPSTYAWKYRFDTGWKVLELVLAREFRLGQLTLKNVLVSPLPQKGRADTAAVIGLTAFGNHVVVVDGPGGRVLIGEPSASLAMPAYNRLGASFGPDMSARVADKSPAAEADIRDGDILVAINGQTPDAYAATAMSYRIWEQPAGTTLQLTLRRESEIVERKVVLRDFLTDGR